MRTNQALPFLQARSAGVYFSATVKVGLTRSRFVLVWLSFVAPFRGLPQATGFAGYFLAFQNVSRSLIPTESIWFADRHILFVWHLSTLRGFSARGVGFSWLTEMGSMTACPTMHAVGFSVL